MKRKIRISMVMIFFIAVLSANFGCAKEISRDQLISDVRQLADILKKPIPTPIYGAAGKSLFTAGYRKPFFLYPRKD